MSGYADFGALLAQTQEGIVDSPTSSGVQKVSLDHLVEFKGNELKYINVRFLAKNDEFFKTGIAKIRKHSYYDAEKNTGVTYDCLLNYNVECPICELQRTDFQQAMRENGQLAKNVNPFIAKTHSKSPEVFAWVYVESASPNMEQYVGKVKLMRVANDVNNLLLNHSNEAWCTERDEPYVNFLHPTEGVTVRVEYDGTVSNKTTAYSRSKLVAKSIGTPMIENEDGTANQEAIMNVYSRIPDYTTHNAKFFSQRICGSENTPESLLKAYTAFSATKPQYQYNSVHPLMAKSVSEAESISGNHNNFGGQAQTQTQAQAQTQTQAQAQTQTQAQAQAPAPKVEPAVEKQEVKPQNEQPTYSDFDDDIPF